MKPMQFVGAIVFAIAFLSTADLVHAQRDFGSVGNKMRFLGNPEVQSELELLDEQKTDIESIQSEARNLYRNAFSGMREKMEGLDASEREALMNEIRGNIETEMEGISKKVEDVLVPHQVERLEQIVLQSQIRRGGTSSLMDNEAFRKKVGLTEDEAKKLKEKEEQVRKDIEEKIKKIREDAQDEILSVLPAAKKEKIKELIGETFEMPERQRTRRGGGGRRGGGQRGGRRGGGA